MHPFKAAEATPIMNELTSRQAELLNQIARIVAGGRTPLTAELQAAMEVSRESSLTDLLRPLERKGYISVQGGVRGRQRIIELTPRGLATSGIGAPVIGEITAGPLREALCQSEQVVLSLSEAVGFRPGDFLLRVTGDSMSGDGILDGDRVLLRPNVALHNGEIAAVQITEGEQWQTTLKRVFAAPEWDYIELRASNPVYEPLQVPCDKVGIAGVYRGLLRGPLHN